MTEGVSDLTLINFRAFSLMFDRSLDTGGFKRRNLELPGRVKLGQLNANEWALYIDYYNA